MPDPFARMRRLARKRAEVEAEFRAEVEQLAAAGHTLRAVAAAAGVTHPTVLRIVRAASPDVGKP